MQDKKKRRDQALAQWREDHNGSSEGFYDEYHAMTKDDYLELIQDRIDRDEIDLH